MCLQVLVYGRLVVWWDDKTPLELTSHFTATVGVGHAFISPKNSYKPEDMGLVDLAKKGQAARNISKLI